jgi:CheY-like chemotaxis protein
MGSAMTSSTIECGRPDGRQQQRKPYQKPTLIKLGRRAEPISTIGTAQDQPAQVGNRNVQEADLRNRRALVVDDDGLFREILRNDLESSGFNVATAADGAEAFRVIPQFSPDVVVMDVRMPGENGYRICRAIKELGSHGMDAAPKIVLLTGRRVDEDPEREAILLDFARADAMLYKPCDPSVLRETIARVLKT